MIKVELLGGQKGGTYEWAVVVPPLRGRSRVPLLDACRALKRAGVATQDKCGLFWPGSSDPSLVTTVGAGSKLTVEENNTDGPRFVKFQEFNWDKK